MEISGISRQDAKPARSLPRGGTRRIKLPIRRVGGFGLIRAPPAPLPPSTQCKFPGAKFTECGEELSSSAVSSFLLSPCIFDSSPRAKWSEIDDPDPDSDEARRDIREGPRKQDSSHAGFAAGKMIILSHTCGGISLHSGEQAERIDNKVDF